MSIKYFLTNLLLLFLSSVSLVSAQTPTSDSATLDEISENVKLRIQETVRDKKTSINLSPETAYMGLLQTLTGNTLSIRTDDGLQLASTSATTRFLRLPAKKSITLDDLAIDGYLIAIGQPFSDKVLDAQTVVLQDTTPQPPANRSTYGLIVSYDPKEFLLTLAHPQTQALFTALISRKATLNRWVSDGTKDPLKRNQSLPVNSPALVIYTPQGAPDGGHLALDVLLYEPSPAP